MNERVQFDLRKEQIEYLKEKYSNDRLIRKILKQRTGPRFDLSEDDYIDFYGWLEDESVLMMDEDQEATEDTYTLEGILDYIYWQTN